MSRHIRPYCVAKYQRRLRVAATCRQKIYLLNLTFVEAAALFIWWLLVLQELDLVWGCVELAKEIRIAVRYLQMNQPKIYHSNCST
jgi:hypothetical protein